MGFVLSFIRLHLKANGIIRQGGKISKDISEKNSDEAQTVSAATEQQNASMEDVATASISLAQLAEGLQNSVSKFRVR